MAVDIKKIFINGKQHYKWTYDNDDVNKDALIDFLSQLEAQPDWKGEITVDNKNKNKNKNITLVAKSIMSLGEVVKKGVMDYGLVEALILHIGLQMLTLHRYGLGVLLFSLNDIIVVDQNYFFLGNLQYVLDIKGAGAGAGAGADNKLILSYPMKLSKEEERFLAPEVLQGKKVLPFITSITVGYYSLAKLCVYCLGLTDLTLGPIMGSKMYFFLQRCLAEEPSERGFLYL